MRIRKIFIQAFIALSILGLLPNHAYSQNTLPIGKHLKDALKLNKKRAPLYAELTNGESLKLSYELMAMESLALLLVGHLDYAAKPYIEAGVGLFDEDLIDMKKTPEYLPHFEDNLAPTQKIEIETKLLMKKWIKKIKKDDLQALYQDAVLLLKIGDLKETNQNCLTRHFVESIARSLKNIEGHREKATSLGLEDPKEILISFLKIQVRSLPWAQSIDKKAFDIQKMNVPLFCRDVPHVPYE